MEHLCDVSMVIKREIFHLLTSSMVFFLSVNALNYCTHCLLHRPFWTLLGGGSQSLKKKKSTQTPCGGYGNHCNEFKKKNDVTKICICEKQWMINMLTWLHGIPIILDLCHCHSNSLKWPSWLQNRHWVQEAEAVNHTKMAIHQHLHA